MGTNARGWRQFKVSRKGRAVVCWVEDDPRLWPCRQVTFKGSRRRWWVEERYEIVLPTPPQRGWKVGGVR